jgi:hypothetical protein
MTCVRTNKSRRSAGVGEGDVHVWVERMGNANCYIEEWFRLMSIPFLRQIYTFVNISAQALGAVLQLFG